MVMTRRRNAAVLAVLAMSAVLVSSACSSSETPSDAARRESASALTSPTPTPSPTPSAAQHEAIVRRLVPSSADTVGWVQASAGRILSTYYPPGQLYLGGMLVAPTDEIVVVKMHGSFAHSAAPSLERSAPPEGDGAASLALMFYNATTDQAIPFRQMWDGNAPDLGIGPGPGIADRELAAQRWDLRLLGTPTVRTT